MLADGLSTVLGLCLKSKTTGEIIPAREIRTILVVRINYRLGNTLFLTPLIKALNRLMPDCEIDVLVGSTHMAPIFENMLGIGRVHSVPRELLRKPISLIMKLRNLRSTHYDLIIDPTGISVGSKLALAALRGHRKLSPKNHRNEWLPVTHAATISELVTHSALKPLELLKSFRAVATADEQRLGIVLTKRETDAGAVLLRAALRDQDQPICRAVVGVFRDARWDKKLQDDWWQRLTVATRSQCVLIDILPHNDARPFSDDMPFISANDVRTLASCLSTLDLFISCDTGPMHLASACGTPTVGLFRTTSPTEYGLLGTHDVSLDPSLFSPEEIAKKITHHLDSLALAA